jgi:hypothetical protein
VVFKNTLRSGPGFAQYSIKGATWAYDPDLSGSSQFEVTFREQPDGQTRVELEHRNIERHGPSAAGIHQGVGGPGGWPGILETTPRSRRPDSAGTKRPHPSSRVRALAC